MQDKQRATHKCRPSDHVRAKIKKCLDATEEDGASSNTPRVCIQVKSRHTQGSRERSDTSVEDKLEEGQVGPKP